MFFASFVSFLMSLVLILFGIVVVGDPASDLCKAVGAIFLVVAVVLLLAGALRDRGSLDDEREEFF